MNTLRGDRVDTVGSAVLQWIVRCCIQCTVSSTVDVANRGSMRADNIHGKWIFPQNADNIHGTWIFSQYADTSTIVFTTRMKIVIYLTTKRTTEKHLDNTSTAPLQLVTSLTVRTTHENNS